MDKNTIIEKIAEIIEEITDIPQDEIQEDSEIMEGLEMSSVEIFTMLGDLENIFNVVIPNKDLRKIFTVGDLAEYIHSHL